MALKTRTRRKQSGAPLFAAIEQAASGSGPRSATHGDLVVKRDGLDCVVEVARGKWFSLQSAKDDIFNELQIFFRGRKYRRVEIEFEAIAPSGQKSGRFGPSRKDYMRLMSWMGGNVAGKTEEQIRSEGYSWRIRLRTSK